MAELCSDKCPVCNKEIDKKANWARILDEDWDELWTVGGKDGIDLPPEALPEDVQMLYYNCVHVDCYEHLA